MKDKDLRWISVENLPIPIQETIEIWTKDDLVYKGFICSKDKLFHTTNNEFIRQDRITHWRLPL